MPPVGFEPTISAGERSQNYTLDHAATGTGYNRFNLQKLYVIPTECTSMIFMDLRTNSDYFPMQP